MTDLYIFLSSTYGNFWLWTILVAMVGFFCGMFMGAHIQAKANALAEPDEHGRDYE